ncbi:MAG: HTH domain-containing protein [Phaeodactylibacter sp.]|nr:HTH domain-containing protein [Phaeodactylibacter sp.]
MTDQQKLYRVFRLIQLLSQPPYRTVAQLDKLLEVNPRTVYRYINLLEGLGYNIDKKDGGRYYLFLEFKEDQQLINPDK